MTTKTYCYEMNRLYSQDIDTITDFNIVKKLLINELHIYNHLSKSKNILKIL